MSEKKLLQGQSALVTGGNTGIGAAICKALAREGANVAVNYISQEDKAESLAKEIRDLGLNALTVKADVSDEAQVKSLFREAVSAFGSLDILVSNAGIQKDAAFVEMTSDDWDAVMAVNLRGAFLCAREAARLFLDQGMVAGRSKAAGKIVFTSSVHEVIPWAGHVNYAASKGGLMLLMKSIAQELAGKKIRVNSIAPGAIKTQINKDAWDSPEEESMLKNLIPYDRVGSPDDIGPAVAWLVSDEADYITGTSLDIDGGMKLFPGFRTGG